jgi:hypothetical protein
VEVPVFVVALAKMPKTTPRERKFKASAPSTPTLHPFDTCKIDCATGTLRTSSMYPRMRTTATTSSPLLRPRSAPLRRSAHSG